MGKIYARLIHDAGWTLDRVKPKYVEATIQGYYDIYGVWLKKDEDKEETVATEA